MVRPSPKEQIRVRIRGFSRDISLVLDYSPDTASWFSKDVPAQFTGMVNVHSHTRTYRGVSLEGALILVSNLRKNNAARETFKRWLLTYLYPRTCCVREEQSKMLKNLALAIEDTK